MYLFPSFHFQKQKKRLEFRTHGKLHIKPDVRSLQVESLKYIPAKLLPAFLPFSHLLSACYTEMAGKCQPQNPLLFQECEIHIPDMVELNNFLSF